MIYGITRTLYILHKETGESTPNSQTPSQSGNQVTMELVSQSVNQATNSSVNLNFPSNVMNSYSQNLSHFRHFSPKCPGVSEEAIMMNFICFYYSAVLFIWFLVTCVRKLAPTFFPSYVCSVGNDVNKKSTWGRRRRNLWSFRVTFCWRIGEAWKSKGM